ncbi:magnesium transporter CorA family protein [Lapidilactobacillus mulanensis]|uniref:Magnesium transporter CorA family protein n=1 Tax=Lapidilactobacillus mulanensis TaxID=2485999 RepID=A0ABW4DMH2_9LACO|nr:magnesium transporter CorA family protein [Lapidilactobacillus mulanensis]
MIHSTSTKNHYQWVQTDAMTPAEREKLQHKFKLTNEMLTYVTDQDESPNYVYDGDLDQELVIVHVPYVIDPDHFRYLTRPVSFLIHQGALFTFNESSLLWVNQIFDSANQNLEIKSPETFILRSLFELMDSYIPIIKAITKKRNQLDKLLNKDAKNKDLLELSYLRQTLTFLLSAIQSNHTVLMRLSKNHFTADADQKMQDLLEDATIEAEQVQRMIEIETQVVDRIADTFDSIVNNNLNDTMKVLTIWSLTMAVPTIITGFYGMNVRLPFASSHSSWLVAIGLSLLGVAWLLTALKVHHKM